MRIALVFARAPVKGGVKTRLVKDTGLSEEDILDLYTAFLEDVLISAGRSSAEKVILFFTPADMEAEMRAVAIRGFGERAFELLPQEGETFSERIDASFGHAFRLGGKQVVMVGSDSPSIKTSRIDEAFSLLEERGGVVLGPSGEGGMYLIGTEAPLQFDSASIFSEGAELVNFARAAVGSGLPLSLLDETTDVDIASDLVTLVSTIESMRVAGYKGDGFPKNTAESVFRLGLSITRNGGTREKRVVKNG